MVERRVPELARNHYAYVGGNPTSDVDPSGLEALPVLSPLPLYVPAAPPGSPLNNAIYNFLEMEAQGATNLYDWTKYLINQAASALLSGALPPGYWPGPAGAEEWGRRNNVGAAEGRRRFHRAKQKCPGSKATDKFGVNPNTGDVIDGQGNPVDNLGDVNPQK